MQSLQAVHGDLYQFLGDGQSSASEINQQQVQLPQKCDRSFARSRKTTIGTMQPLVLDCNGTLRGDLDSFLAADAPVCESQTHFECVAPAAGRRNWRQRSAVSIAWRSLFTRRLQRDFVHADSEETSCCYTRMEDSTAQTVHRPTDRRDGSRGLESRVMTQADEEEGEEDVFSSSDPTPYDQSFVYQHPWMLAYGFDADVMYTQSHYW